MLFFTELESIANETRMIVTTLIIIFYLVVIELASTNKDEKEASRIFNPTILVLIVIFAFIVMTKVLGILKK